MAMDRTGEKDKSAYVVAAVLATRAPPYHHKYKSVIARRFYRPIWQKILWKPGFIKGLLEEGKTAHISL
jgi:hypothetical protein